MGTAFVAALRTNYPEACRMPRRQRSTVRSICVPSLPFDHALVNDVVALLGRRSSGNRLKHIRIGIATPSPTAIASPLRSAGKKFIKP